MAIKSRGRGTAAAFGLVLVLVGVAGAAVLWVLSMQRPDRAVEGFARGPVGCTVTLDFTDTGTFYVYEEQVPASSDVFDSCEPVPIDGQAFEFELRVDGREVAVRDDSSISYDTDVAVGTSAGRVEIVDPGRYELAVRGSDPSSVAAVGRAPDAGVSDLQRGAIVVGVVGVVLGGLMLVLAGRRSSKAATYSSPLAPGSGPEQRPVPPDAVWPPAPPTIRQVPINPLAPSGGAEPQVSPPTAPEPAAPPASPSDMEAEAEADEPAPWAPPDSGSAAAPLPPPEGPPPPPPGR